MRIAIIVDCYYPHSTASAKLVRDLGVELRKQGHDVTVITPNHLNTRDIELSREEGLLIARIKTGRLKGVSRAPRAIRETRLSATMWRKGRSFFPRSSTRPDSLLLAKHLLRSAGSEIEITVAMSHIPDPARHIPSMGRGRWSAAERTGLQILPDERA
jgi:hypothetical protein